MTPAFRTLSLPACELLANPPGLRPCLVRKGKTGLLLLSAVAAGRPLLAAAAGIFAGKLKMEKCFPRGIVTLLPDQKREREAALAVSFFCYSPGADLSHLEDPLTTGLESDSRNAPTDDLLSNKKKGFFAGS